MAWWMVLEGQARAKRLKPGSLTRVHEYLGGTWGGQAPSYRHPLQRPKQYFPGLNGKPWHEPVDFQWTKVLEQAHNAITKEYLAVHAQGQFRRQHQGLDDAGEWNVYYLYYLGKKVEEHCRYCPETTAVIESFPELAGTGLVYFSVLSGGTHIAAHCGPLNTRLRCHLGLVVPEGARIRVGTESRPWRDGACLVFDDSFEHEVWNTSSTPRAVLIVDFWHPDLTPDETWALGQVMRVSPEARRSRKQILGRG